MNVGFVGLGAMDLPMATRVPAGGYKRYTTFHRRHEPAPELEALGAEVLQNPGEVAQVADLPAGQPGLCCRRTIPSCYGGYELERIQAA